MTIALAFALVPRLGVWGVVLAMIAGAGVRLMVTLLAFRKGLGVDIPRLLLGKADIAVIASTVKRRFGIST